MIIPPDRLPADTLQSILESYVMREGTDYGEVEKTLQEKTDDLKRAVAVGDVVIVYDADLDSINLMLKQDYHGDE